MVPSDVQRRTFLRAFVALAVSGTATLAQQADAARTVSVRGTVFDSLARTPLAGANVRFVPEETPGSGGRSVSTAADGAFEIALPSGRWLASVEDPRLDSLGVTVSPRRVAVPRASRFSLALGIPSPLTLVHAFCGKHAGDAGTLVGMVRSAGSMAGIDSARVLLQWTELTFGRGGITRTQPVAAVQADRNGWYVVCGLPAIAEIVAWAERGGAVTGALLKQLDGVPARLDFSIDTTAPAATPGVRRADVLVHDLGGHPVAAARVRLLGQPFVLTDARGFVTLDSVAGGSQTLEVVAVGFAPDRRAVEIGAGETFADTVALAPLESDLDTVRVIAGHDGTGFDMRRLRGLGQYITAADIARENPENVTSLLRSLDGMQYVPSGGRERSGTVLMTRGPGRRCRPALWVDGFPAPPMELNWLFHPDEIGGIEVYDVAAKVPAQFIDPGNNRCGVIVIWTREKLNLPKALVPIVPLFP